ncbi:MAG: hypothetical protein ABI091_26035 [Ferruginibacter sp.]
MLFLYKELKMIGKLIIRGKTEYFIDNKTSTLEESDSIFFDGRIG